MKTSHYILYTLLKIMAVFFIAFILFFVGLMIGYGVIGDGSPMAVFHSDLWGNLLRFLK
ncbi:DNA-directed RNA polymerase subunit beta [Enterococcus sp. LJL98]